VRYDIGHHHPFPPEAIDEADTEFVDAGSVRIGVEVRRLEGLADRLRATYEGSPFEGVFRDWMDARRATAQSTTSQNASQAPTGMTGPGLSLHVLDADSGYEYLRFDCFDGVPHYHYLRPWATPEECDNHEVDWDEVANGPMLPWALDRIRTRLPEMLTEAGGADLAARVDHAAVELAVDRVGELAYAAVAEPVA
jgi:hypothetical protein